MPFATSIGFDIFKPYFLNLNSYLEKLKNNFNILDNYNLFNKKYIFLHFKVHAYANN